MRKLLAGFLLCSSLIACSSSTSVLVGSAGQAKPIRSAAFVPQDGNSAAMDAQLQRELMGRGVEIKAKMPPGTRKASDVDAIVAYSDVWRWDLVMYLKSLDINIFDAKTGSLVANGHWENSALHGFSDSAAVIKQVVDEMFQKLGWPGAARTADANK